MRSKGGKFEGEGSYACTFSPAPKCTGQEEVVGNLKKKKKDIAKVFHSQHSMEEEWVYSKQMAYVSEKELRKDPTADQCSFLSGNKNTMYPMLKMAHGGVNLDAYFENNLLNMNILVDITISVLKGLRKLAKNRIIHNDLKFNNIVYDPQTGNTRVIDFGLSMKMADAFKPQKNRFLKSKYWLHPPEYRLTQHLGSTPINRDDARKMFREEYDLLDIYFSDSHPTTLISFITDKLYSYCDYEALYMKYVMRISKMTGDVKEYMTKHAAKVDLYSLGISLIHLSLFVTYKSPRAEARFLEVIKALVHPDPSKRPSIGKLITMLETSKQ
jgi:serine/threonine protein kinase